VIFYSIEEALIVTDRLLCKCIEREGKKKAEQA
jgi:hypothetical protein